VCLDTMYVCVMRVGDLSCDVRRRAGRRLMPLNIEIATYSEYQDLEQFERGQRAVNKDHAIEG
jgi:hypothetical protein